MSGPLLAGLWALPFVVLITWASYGTDRGWPWLLTRGAALSLMLGGAIGVVVVLTSPT